MQVIQCLGGKIDETQVYIHADYMHKLPSLNAAEISANSVEASMSPDGPRPVNLSDALASEDRILRSDALLVEKTILSKCWEGLINSKVLLP